MSSPQALAARVAELTGRRASGLRAVGGGDICRAFAADLAGAGRCFVKTLAGAAPGFFATEASGLRWLAAAGALPVPEVLGVGDDLLVLAWVDSCARTDEAAQSFGRGLARLHRAGAEAFGAPPGAGDAGWLGSVPVDNARSADGGRWWAERRLLPLVRRAVEASALPASATPLAGRVAERAADLLATGEPPARVHGDLWVGNVVWARGTGALVDPSAHGGFREADLAMMQLFGGFGAAVLSAYQEEWPLVDGWRDRVALHQLVPLLVHAILFRGGYGGRVLELLGRFG